jgi:hypothetical protein
MRIIKLGIISAIVFALLLTGMSLFLPSHIRISKAVDIQTSRDSLLYYTTHTQHWPAWYPGARSMVVNNDKMITDSSGTSTQITAVSDSAISLITSGQRTIHSGWNIMEAATPNAFTIQWFMDFQLHWYPWEKFSGLTFEKRYGPEMEQGLKNLKVLLEK